jgi:protein AroM
VEKRQLGVIVPIASQIASERDKWGALARPPLFAAVSPYSDGPEAVLATGERLQAERAEAVLLDCIGSPSGTAPLAALDMPVMLSNAVVAKAVGELFGG